MRPPKYPLDPLAKVRARDVDDAAQKLAGSVNAREKAQGARVASERARDDHEEAARRAREEERAKLERGELRAADLMQQDAWEVRVASERAAHERRVDDTASKEAAAREDERAARGGLASRKADEAVVAKHREAWDGREKKAREARDEEAAVEAWRPKAAKR